MASWRMARSDEYRHAQLAALVRDLNDVAVADTEPLRGGRRDQRGVVPRQLGDRLGQFLQPAVVGEAAVVDGRVAAEVHLEAR